MLLNNDESGLPSPAVKTYWLWASARRYPTGFCPLEFGERGRGVFKGPLAFARPDKLENSNLA